jgi:hypothetical protein
LSQRLIAEDEQLFAIEQRVQLRLAVGVERVRQIAANLGAEGVQGRKPVRRKTHFFTRPLAVQPWRVPPILPSG